MSGDYSRFTDHPRKRYTGVRMQQGRVQLDADWNEEVDILKRRWEIQAEDTFGAAAALGDGFKVIAITDRNGKIEDLVLRPGRIYVNGKLAEIFEGEMKVRKEDAPVSYLYQPFYPKSSLPEESSYIVYLDVWDREVTYLEDPDLLEKALGGVDTATRIQTVWQVKVLPIENASCGINLDELFPASTGRLSTRATPVKASADPCALSPTSGYRGLENRLYRVEIHKEGNKLEDIRFKWSRENASVISEVEKIDGSVLTVSRIGRDKVLRFQQDDWVEVIDDDRELTRGAGLMAKVNKVVEADRTITLDRNVIGSFGNHTRVRRWDQGNGVDPDGLLTPTADWIALEDGIEVKLTLEANGEFNVGDYWVFAARTADNSVEALPGVPPKGIEHFYCQLAAVNEEQQIEDCRPKWPPEAKPVAAEGCCTVTVGDGKTSHGDFDEIGTAFSESKLRVRPGLPIRICVLPGGHRLRETVVIDRTATTVFGCGVASVISGPPGGTFFSVEAANVRFENLHFSGGQREVIHFFQTYDGDVKMNTFLGVDLKCEDMTGLSISGNTFRSAVLKVKGGRDLLITENSFFGERFPDLNAPGLLTLEGGSSEVQFVDNFLGYGSGHGIKLGSDSNVLIANNTIREMRECGILGMSTKDLRIEGNTIVDCVSREASTLGREGPYGGIVLNEVAHAQILNNRIESNGAAEAIGFPVAGIAVRICHGLIVRGNLVTGNGPAADGGRIPGLQGGILGQMLSVKLGGVDVEGSEQQAFIQPDGWPAAAIQDNVVVAPRGPALLLVGVGPMQVSGNRLTSRDVLWVEPSEGQPRGEDLLSWLVSFFGSVVICNAGLPPYLISQALALGFDLERINPALWTPDSLTAEKPQEAPSGKDLPLHTASGKVHLSDNQITLDLTRKGEEKAVAAVGVLTLDDLALHDNQTHCTLSNDRMWIDTLAVATSLRATGNCFAATLPFCYFSLVALGYLMCTATSNQGTHCINAYTLKSGISHVVSRHNLSLICQADLQSEHLKKDEEEPVVEGRQIIQLDAIWAWFQKVFGVAEQVRQHSLLQLAANEERELTALSKAREVLAAQVGDTDPRVRALDRRLAGTKRFVEAARTIVDEARRPRGDWVVAGRVLDAEGQPLASAKVRLATDDADLVERFGEVKTDAGGRFEVRHSAEAFRDVFARASKARLVATSEDGKLTATTHEIQPAGDQIHALDIRLAPKAAKKAAAKKPPAKKEES